MSRDFRRPFYYLWRTPLLLLHLGTAIILAIFVVNRDHAHQRSYDREPVGHRVIRWWSARLMRILGIRVVCFGQPESDPVMFVANHTSWLDIQLLHTQRAACFVAKAEISKWPLLGWIAASGGSIFHRRGSTQSLSRVIQTMSQRLQEGRSVAAFPEGTTGHGGVMKTFHARIFQVAMDTKVPLQPVALKFTRHGQRVLDIGFHENEGFARNFLRVLGNAPTEAEVHFLEVVPALIQGRRNMATLARTQIERVLESYHS